MKSAREIAKQIVPDIDCHMPDCARCISNARLRALFADALLEAREEGARWMIETQRWYVTAYRDPNDIDAADVRTEAP